ncbi:MAG: hypothetical protein IKD44_02485 [Lentisphaeria bacterium]|nr:hypothetical protein [Lentisphaeria bacterium]
MKIEKCVLQELLQVLGKVVRPESVVEEYKSVWFVGIPGSFQVEAVATDGEQYVSVTVEATDDKEINFALPFAELEQRAADCQGEALEIEGRYRALPEMPSPPADAVTTALPEKIGDLLTRAIPIVDCKAEREILRGINFSASGIVAANKEMLLHFPCPLTLKQDVTLPVPPFALPAEEKGCLHIWRDRFQMQIGNVKWQKKILEGEFPDWRNIVPSDTSLNCTVNLKEPEKIIDFLQSFPEQQKDDLVVFRERSGDAFELASSVQNEHFMSIKTLTTGAYPGTSLCLDRGLLLKALQMGYSTLKLRDVLNPVVLSGESGYCVVMPRRIENTFRPVGGKRGKIFGTIFACIALLLLLAAGKTFLKSGVERFVENQIQQCANRLTGRDVYVGSISYDLWKQRVEIRKLGVPNPQGYSQGVPAIYIDRIAMELMPWEIFKNLLHIKELNVSGVRINTELKKYPQSFKEAIEILRSPGINLVALKSGAQKRSTSSSAAEKKVFIKIDKVQITDSSVSFKYKWSFGFALPDYTRQNIGKEGNLTPDQLAAEVYNFHLKEMQLKAIRKLEEIKKASESALKDLMSRMKEKYSKKKEQEIAK